MSDKKHRAMSMILTPHNGICCSMELGIRFADWCAQHRDGMPTWRQIADRWGVSTATAYRWLAALRAARGLIGPEAGEE